MAMPDGKGRKVYCQSKFKKKTRTKGSTRFSNREIIGDLEESSANKTMEAEARLMSSGQEAWDREIKGR